MTATVGMYNGVFSRRQTGYSAVKHRINKFCVGASAYRPTNRHTIEAVNDGRQIDFARWYVKLSEICQPFLIWLFCVKVAFQQVRYSWANLTQVGTVTASFLSLYHKVRSEEHTSELQSRPHLVCRLLLEKK